jgi:hypothetical protein
VVVGLVLICEVKKVHVSLVKGLQGECGKLFVLRERERRYGW